MTASIIRPATTVQSASHVRVLPDDRVAPLRRPQVLKPNWEALDSRGNSNTFGYSSAPVARSIPRRKMDRISGANECLFDNQMGWVDRVRARTERIIHSPGGTAVSLGVMSTLLGFAPLLIP